MRQDEIPGHVKFDLLAQAARLRGAPPAEVGRAYLYASWSARQQGAPVLDDFEEWKTLLQRYGLHRSPFEIGRRNRTELELEAAARLEADLRAGKAVGAPRALAFYFAAWLYRRHQPSCEPATGHAAGIRRSECLLRAVAHPHRLLAGRLRAT